MRKKPKPSSVEAPPNRGYPERNDMWTTVEINEAYLFVVLFFSFVLGMLVGVWSKS